MSKLGNTAWGVAAMLALCATAAAATDHRFDGAIARPARIVFNFQPASAAALFGREAGRDLPAIPQDYASAMIWYRSALSGGFEQPPLVARSWAASKDSPEDPLRFAWAAENGDLITRAGKGVFRLSFGSSRNNWFREIDCRLISWPDGKAKALMDCADGSQRTMEIPSEGTVVVDAVTYTRALRQEQELPPAEEFAAEPEAPEGEAQ